MARNLLARAPVSNRQNRIAASLSPKSQAIFGLLGCYAQEKIEFGLDAGVCLQAWTVEADNDPLDHP